MFTAKRAPALLAAAVVPMLLIVLLAHGGGGHAAASTKTPWRSPSPAPPSASKFAAEFIGVTNQYAEEHGDAAHVGHAHCVQAAPGRYMCAYVVATKGTPTCRLMQARWTPGRASTITVTLSGRTARCTTVREAVRSLR
jgi:hypothetical protein